MIGCQVGIFARHHRHYFVHHLGAGYLFHSEQMGVPDSPAHDAAEHIASVFVGREHSVRDQKSHGSCVLRHDAKRKIAPRVFAIGNAGDLCSFVHEARHLVDLEHGSDFLEDNEQPLQASPRVYARLRQRMKSVGTLLGLHEH